MDPYQWEDLVGKIVTPQGGLDVYRLMQKYRISDGMVETSGDRLIGFVIRSRSSQKTTDEQITFIPREALDRFCGMLQAELLFVERGEERLERFLEKRRI